MRAVDPTPLSSGIESSPTPDAPESMPEWVRHRRLSWIRSADRWLCARVDEPDDRVARGAVIVAPSFDREAVVSFRTTRALAARARRAGFVAYTFAWSGDADSSTLPEDGDLARLWLEDLTAVIGHARGLVGPDAPVHVVGLRLGAAVAALLPDHGPGRRLYWEPISGGSFLRHHKLIRQTSVPVPTLESVVELDGMTLTPAQVSGLRRLRAPSAASLGPHEELRTESDRRAAMRLVLGAPYFAHVPHAALDEIVERLPAGEPVDLPAWTPQLVATMSVPDAEGRPATVTEAMCEIGPKRLPGIVTRSADVAPRAAVLFTAMGAEIKAGPGGAWSRAARELAPEGVLSLRADRGGLGDDADPDHAPEPRPYTDSAVLDVASATSWLSGRGLPVIGVGVCAGAWALLRAAADHDAALRAVFGVNVVHWSPDSAVYTEAFYAHYHGQEAADRSAPADRSPEGRSPEGTDTPDDAEGDIPGASRRGAGTVLRGGLSALRELVSTELAIRLPRLRSALRPDVPLDLTEPLLRTVPRRVGITLLYGCHDHRIFLGKGGGRSMRRATRGGQQFEVVVDPAIDHSLFAQAAQRETLEQLRRRIDAEAPVIPTEPATAPAPSTAEPGAPVITLTRVAGVDHVRHQGQVSPVSREAGR